MSRAATIPAWEKYRPSSGTEGIMFIERWCANCARDAAARNGNYEKGCRILADTLLYEIDDANYPKEWVRQANDGEWPGTARCTAFVPMQELSDRAKRAWETRRQNRRDSCRDLFKSEPKP